jgi:hypothetical protein
LELKQKKVNQIQTINNTTDLQQFFLLFSDPHVRIVGKQEDVMSAKDKIMLKLDSRVSLILWGKK